MTWRNWYEIAALSVCWVLMAWVLGRRRLRKRPLTALGGFALGFLVAMTLHLPGDLPLSDAGQQWVPLGIVAFLIALFIGYELACRAREKTGQP